LQLTSALHHINSQTAGCRRNAVARQKNVMASVGDVLVSAMISVLLGLTAAFSWSIHDLLARRFAGGIGPFRMSFWIMLAGAAVLVVPVFLRGQIFQAEQSSVAMALAMGLVYAFALGSLLLAFSLAPVSIVGPLTAGYPALVVVWGLSRGIVPSAMQWLAIALVLLGVWIVSRSSQEGAISGGVAKGKMPLVIAAAVVADISFAAAVVMGQSATQGLGEYEVTFLSRFPAAALLLALMLKDRAAFQPLSHANRLAIGAMAVCDVLAVTAINAAAWFPNRELGAMAISSYGALSVLMAMVFLRERVTALQWLGIFSVVMGVAVLAWPG
jgi:drug/metabolite transporter (DMT)-like permease